MTMYSRETRNCQKMYNEYLFMKSLKNRITETNTLLAPYAVPLAGTLGRPEAEADDETRFPFQRDRDRIIHTQAFRRLQGKTQVFVSGESDHFRSRLTHTMEVAQLSRDIARTMSLNEDLAECIALAHDLGHPPFAHMGEMALDTWMKKQHSRFEHNEQSLRIVTMLEQHSQHHPGLNLNREVLEGMQKHLQRTAQERSLSLEAQIVNIADEIAYSAHDCDDGIAAGLFTSEELSVVPLATTAQAMANARGTSLRGALIHLLVSDLYATTDAMLAAKNIRTLDDVYAAKKPLVLFSESFQERITALHDFLHRHMYGNPRVREANIEGQKIITHLCDMFLAHPTEKILLLQKKTGSGLAEAVRDYVAGMTDAYAKTADIRMSSFASSG